MWWWYKTASSVVVVDNVASRCRTGGMFEAANGKPFWQPPWTGRRERAKTIGYNSLVVLVSTAQSSRKKVRYFSRSEPFITDLLRGSAICRSRMHMDVHW